MCTGVFPCTPWHLNPRSRCARTNPRAHPTVLEARATPGGLEITADAFARQVRIAPCADLEGLFEDNYFDLPAKQTRTVRILDCPVGRLTVRAVNANIVEVELPA